MPDTGMLDLSPLVAFIIIYVVQIVIFDTAYHYLMDSAMSLKLRG
jgi:YggT family protein